ncbi:MAG TPA: helix-turn-helix domain-containing protein [Blastocatellia bacterium]
MMENVLTVTQAAERLGVADAHVRLLIKQGKLKADKHGSLWLLTVEEVDRYQKEKKPRGRPVKTNK